MESINFFILRFCCFFKFRVVHTNRYYIYIKESYSEVKWEISASKCLSVFNEGYVCKVFPSLYVSFSV